MIDTNKDFTSNPETNFRLTAEQAAMGKLTDINNTPLYKHSFARFVSGTEDVDGNEVDRLSTCLQYGLVSEDLASKIGIPYPRNFHLLSKEQRTGPKEISLSGIHATIKQSIIWAVFAEFGKGIKIPKDNIYILLISPDITARMYSGGLEARKERSISPRRFQGIVIIGDRPKLENAWVDYNSSDTEKTINNTVSLMLATYRKHPELAIPLYDTSGALLWPKKMTYQELKMHLAQKGKK